MTTPTERAAQVITASLKDRAWADVQPLDFAQVLHDANLLAAPVDGELREALERTLYDASGDQVMPHLERGRMVTAQADQLLPIIAAHVAEEKRKLREEIAAADDCPLQPIRQE